MRFLVDAQLPPALVTFLRDSGHDCDHVSGLGMLTASDTQIYQYAQTHNAVIVTKDEDFANQKALRPGMPAVVWLRVGNCSNRALLLWLAPLMPTILDRLGKGDDLVEII